MIGREENNWKRTAKVLMRNSKLSIPLFFFDWTVVYIFFKVSNSQ